MNSGGIPPGHRVHRPAPSAISPSRSFPKASIPQPPGPWSILNDPGTNPNTGLDSGPAQPISAFVSVFGYDAFHPNTQLRQLRRRTTNGVVFFPGSSAVYVDGANRRRLGASGDGVNQDDLITPASAAGFTPPHDIEADNYFYGERSLAVPEFRPQSGG